ncbi:hypothetical protein EON77_00845 [bacterium]|nr:MAG: hypothetical protein EON77_00845 [bacterium]
MKTLLPASILVLAALVASAAPRKGGNGMARQANQKQIWRDNKGDVTVLANSGVADSNRKTNVTQFTVAGNVAVASRLQGIAMSAARMTGTIEPDPAKKGAQRLDALRATGGVTIVRTRTEAVAGKAVAGRTDAKGDSGTYDAGAGDAGTATLKGNVVIIDELGGRKVNLLGNEGTVNFSTAQRGNSALKGAVMTGNVRIKVTEVDQAGTASVYNAAGDRLEYAKAGVGATLTLSGHVKLDSPGEGGGTSEGIERLVLTLGADGTLEHVKAFTDAPDARVRTTYRPKKSPVKPAGKTGQ